MPFYCYSDNNEGFVGKFDNIEDAKLAFLTEQKPQANSIYYIGEVIEYSSRNFISVLSLVDNMRGQAIFEVGEDQVGKWPDISPSKYHDLREQLVKFFDENYPVNFTGVQNVKSFIVGE